MNSWSPCSSLDPNGTHSWQEARGPSVWLTMLSHSIPRIRRSFQRFGAVQAKLSASQMDIYEAHGTGTSLGDPIEISAVKKALGSRAGVGQWTARKAWSRGHAGIPLTCRRRGHEYMKGGSLRIQRLDFDQRVSSGVHFWPCTHQDS